MPAPVYFRGPILFRITPEKATEALVPDAERTLRSPDGTPGYHPDGSPAAAHYAGLMVAKGSEILAQLSLRGKLVTISDGTTTTCTYPKPGLVPVDDTVNAVMPENAKAKLISPSDNAYWARVTSRVTFAGGTLSEWKMTAVEFRVPPATTAAPICIAPVWTPSSQSTSIEITEIDGSRRIVLHPTDDQQVYLYNWDVFEPQVVSITDVPKGIANAVESEDTDFKWLYQLFDVPETFVDAKVAGQLPAPKAMASFEKKGSDDTPTLGSASCVAGSTKS